MWPQVTAFVVEHKLPFIVTGGAIAVSGTIWSLVSRARAAKPGEQLVEKLRSVIGTPYIWGSRDPHVGLDCSGAIVWALRSLDRASPSWNATAASLRKLTSWVAIPLVGDLAFYGPLFGDPTHVMAVVGDGTVIGASGGGPSTKTVEAARVKNAAVKILPVKYRDDFRSYGRLPILVGDHKRSAVGGLCVLGAMRI